MAICLTVMVVVEVLVGILAMDIWPLIGGGSVSGGFVSGAAAGVEAVVV